MERARMLYCHICKKDFQSEDRGNFKCMYCESEFCEEFSSENNQDDPRQFVPYGEV